MNLKLLEQVKKQYGLSKMAYVPAPFDQNIQGMEESPQDGGYDQQQQGGYDQQQGGGVSEPIMSEDQLLQELLAAKQKGADPQQLVESLLQRGVPQETLQKVIQQLAAMEEQEQGGQQMPAQGGGQQMPAPAPEQMPAPSMDVNSEIESYIKAEREKLKSQKLTPEERLFYLEKKVEALVKIVQNFVGGMPPKTSSDHALYEAMLEAMEYSGDL